MAPTRADYLQTEVTTATPQRLQLLLIEGALRAANQAQQHWDAQRDDAACLALIRSQNVVAELLSVINPRSADPLARRAQSVYLFIYRALVAAGLEHDEAKLHDALRVLEVERETWQLVCRRLGSHEAEASTAGRASFVA